MVEFMLIAAPRSGTTWAANWLTTEKTLCLHDPLSNTHYQAWNAIKTIKRLGVADTGIALFPRFLRAHPARKVIVHRPIDDINTSLSRAGLPMITNKWKSLLDSIEGMHVGWNELFEKPQPIYEYLTELPFDSERHAELMKMHVQPFRDRIEINRELMNELAREAALC